MKQYITIKDLNQLSEKGKKRLREWSQSKGYGKDELVQWTNGEKTMMPFDLLSIGQMIEFLAENNELFIGVEENPWNEKRNLQLTFFNTKIGKAPSDICDELWEAVKEILNKE